MTVSLCRSSDDVASSKISTRGRARKARAERELLTFAGRERLAPLVHRRVESLGKSVHQVAQPHDVDGGVDLFLGRFGVAEAQVGADGSREEERLLGHDAEL